MGTFAASAAAEDYWIKVQPTLIDAYQVEAAVTTNILGLKAIRPCSSKCAISRKSK